MISLFRKLIGKALLIILLYACNDNDALDPISPSELSFAIELKELDAVNLRQVSSRVDNISKLYLTVTKENGEATSFQGTPVEFTKEGNSLVVENVALANGNYQLTELIIEDYTGHVTYASPLSQSKLGSQTTVSLPFAFSIGGNTVQKVELGAIATRGFTLSDFGLKDRGIVFKDEADCDGGVFEGNITLSNQDAVNNFASNCYTEINGDLRIQLITRPLDLSPLKSLRAIHGILDILGSPYDFLGNPYSVNPPIATMTLEGLHNLEYIAVVSMLEVHYIRSLEGFRGLKEVIRLYMSNVSNVPNLKGLENLEKCQLLRVNSFNHIENLEGLTKLEQIDILQLTRLPSITAFKGTHSLSHIGSLSLSGPSNWNSSDGAFDPALQEVSSIHINMSNFKDLNGIFPAETRITKRISIDNNHHLESLEGINFVKDIESIAIARNSKLVDVSALSGLVSIADRLEFRHNESLKSLHGLETLETISSEIEAPLKVINNSGLTDLCALTPFFKNNPGFDALIEENKFNPLPDDISNGDCSLE
jgi:hypothetical protein